MIIFFPLKPSRYSFRFKTFWGNIKDNLSLVFLIYSKLKHNLLIKIKERKSISLENDKQAIKLNEIEMGEINTIEGQIINSPRYDIV